MATVYLQELNVVNTQRLAICWRQRQRDGKDLTGGRYSVPLGPDRRDYALQLASCKKSQFRSLVRQWNLAI